MTCWSEAILVRSQMLVYYWLPGSIQYKTVGTFSCDGIERDASIAGSFSEVPFFDNIAPKPLVSLFSFDEEAIGKVQYDIVQITSLNDFQRDVIRSSCFSFKYLRFCSFLFRDAEWASWIVQTLDYNFYFFVLIVYLWLSTKQCLKMIKLVLNPLFRET